MPPSTPTGAGVKVPPEVAAWMVKARRHVKNVWVVPVHFREQSLATQVVIRLDGRGRVQGKPRVVRGSGDLNYDDGVVDAILRANPLPPPPEAGEWPFVFDSEERY